MHEAAPIAAPGDAVARESTASRLERGSFHATLGLLCGFGIILLIAPTVVVLITSLTDSPSLKFPPPGYSLQWYAALWHDSPEIVDAAILSFKVAAIATVSSVLLAGSAALALARRTETWARVLDSIFMSPLMLPALALGLALLALFNLLGAGLSMWTLVIGHIAITTPYVLRTTIASYVQLDPQILESAHSLGAKPFFAFRTITLPLIAPGVAAGAFIAFMASFDNVAVSLFLSDARSEVLPIRLWTMIETNLDVRAAAVSGFLVTTTAVAALVMERIVGLSSHIR
jgi:putative spermidine/putrescine transport system permease protein